MRYLLDTHIWIWSLLEPSRISRRIARLLEQPGTELWLSPVSIWELMMLVDRGRVVVDGDRETHRVRLEHRDPADRFLVATAKVFDLTLITADRRLIGAEGISILADR